MTKSYANNHNTQNGLRKCNQREYSICIVGSFSWIFKAYAYTYSHSLSFETFKFNISSTIEIINNCGSFTGLFFSYGATGKYDDDEQQTEKNIKQQYINLTREQSVHGLWINHKYS